MSLRWSGGCGSGGVSECEELLDTLETGKELPLESISRSSVLMSRFRSSISLYNVLSPSLNSGSLNSPSPYDLIIHIIFSLNANVSALFGIV